VGPDIRYARNDDVAIAYQVVGGGERDLVFVPDYVSNLVYVSTGARVAAAAETGEVVISQTVKDLVAGSGLSFDERGEHELKGVPGTWRIHAAVQP
jgi:class 3 adenylate cyclase